mmetsp:Transcript_26205/g.59407  ORF Transcript_26205/g.59407 Transcript_26205/m.59407 type:complete len:207 (-) Transcript_26205:408-1028(-)
MLRSAMSLPLRCSSLLRAIPACHHMHKPSPSPSLSSSPTSSFTSRPISTSVELRYPRTTLAGRAFCLPRAFGATRFFSSLPPHMELAFPALSPTMKTGNIAKWMVKIGQKIAPGDHLCDVETDKATMAWEAQEDGFVAAILKEDGASDVAVGEIVMVLCESVSDVKAFENFKPSAPQAAAAAAAPMNGTGLADGLNGIHHRACEDH